MNDALFLHKALEQAYLGRGYCSPNPCVGAVAVQNGTILAAGFHEGPGCAHAERVVLSKLPPHLSDVTLYVTLEPCNHWGRTPPCVDAIIDYGIKRVVYAYADPNPIVANQDTSGKLKEKGIEVCFCPLPEINAFYEPYAYWVQTQKPLVTVKLAQSLDGKIAGQGGAAVTLSNEKCAEFTHAQRKQSDCILTTAQTILNDDPAFTVRMGNEVKGKRIVILDRKLRLGKQARVFEKALSCLIYYGEDVEMREEPHPCCEYIPLPVLDFFGNSTSEENCFVDTVLESSCTDLYTTVLRSVSPRTSLSEASFRRSPMSQKLDLNALFKDLGKRGMHDVWVEAGGTLFAALHHEGLVQRTYIYVTPHVLGGQAVGPDWNKAIFQRRHSVSWRLLNDNAILSINWQEESCLQG